MNKKRHTIRRKVARWTRILTALLLSFCFWFPSSIALAQWATSSNNIYNTNSGNVGVGTNSPGAKLEVLGDQMLRMNLDRNLFFSIGSGGNTDTNQVAAIRAIVDQTSPLKGILEFRVNTGNNSKVAASIGTDGTFFVGEQRIQSGTAPGTIVLAHNRYLRSISANGTTGIRMIGINEADDVVIGGENTDRIFIGDFLWSNDGNPQNDRFGRVCIRCDQTSDLNDEAFALVVEKGDVKIDGDAYADKWFLNSSKRGKENIVSISNPLEKVQKLRGVYFDRKKTKHRDLGMIAEEVGEVVPELVSYEPNSTDAIGLDYARLTALLVEAIKEQQTQIETQTEQIGELREIIEKLKN